MLVPGIGVGNMVASMVGISLPHMPLRRRDAAAPDMPANGPCTLSPQALLQMAIFGGFLTNTADTPRFLNWLRWLSLFYYPFEACPAATYREKLARRHKSSSCCLRAATPIVRSSWRLCPPDDDRRC